jgi:hypothetical protein
MALVTFAGGTIAVINMMPAIIFSAAMISTPLLVAVGFSGYFTLLAMHALTVTAAGALAFLSVLGVRELVHALLGTRLFTRISMILQAALVVCVVLFLCMLPRMSNHVGQVWLASERPAYVMPPLWFVGLYEAGAGHVVDNLPRTSVPRRMLPFDREATQMYRGREAEFRRLAFLALTSLFLAFVVTAAAYTWNNRQLPPAITAHTNQPHHIRALFVGITERFIVRRPLVRAGFFFTLQTLWRSSTHRLTMAVVGAVGLAVAALGARGANVLVIQPTVLLLLLAGFRHAARVPAELRANWAFQMCWEGDSGPYVTGVKRAALFSIVAPALLAMLPLHAALLGWPAALLHSVFGVLLANVGLEVAMLGFRTLPFASSYAGGTNLKGWMPVFFLMVPLTYILAGIERMALSDPTSGIIWALVLVAAILVARVFERRQRESYGPVDFYELPQQTQRLDLTV